MPDPKWVQPARQMPRCILPEKRYLPAKDKTGCFMSIRHANFDPFCALCSQLKACGLIARGQWPGLHMLAKRCASMAQPMGARHLDIMIGGLLVKGLFRGCQIAHLFCWSSGP